MLSHHSAQPEAALELACPTQTSCSSAGSCTRAAGQALHGGWEQTAPAPKFHPNNQTKDSQNKGNKGHGDEEPNFPQWILVSPHLCDTEGPQNSRCWSPSSLRHRPTNIFPHRKLPARILFIKPQWEYICTE